MGYFPSDRTLFREVMRNTAFWAVPARDLELQFKRSPRPLRGGCELAFKQLRSQIRPVLPRMPTHALEGYVIVKQHKRWTNSSRYGFDLTRQFGDRASDMGCPIARRRAGHGHHEYYAFCAALAQNSRDSCKLCAASGAVNVHVIDRYVARDVR